MCQQTVCVCVWVRLFAFLTTVEGVGFPAAAAAAVAYYHVGSLCLSFPLLTVYSSKRRDDDTVEE